jgi:hypothetical protein
MARAFFSGYDRCGCFGLIVVTLAAVHHVFRFVAYLMAGTSAAGLLLVLYLLFQLEYGGAEAESERRNG